MLPRASLHDRSLVAGARRVLRPMAWWRSRSLGWFVVGHCATAGVLQLGALLVELERTGKPMPSGSALVWAALGLAIVACVPALLSTVIRSVVPARTGLASMLQASIVGVVFYGVLPVLALGSSVQVIAMLVPVAVAWHMVFALAPPLQTHART